MTEGQGKAILWIAIAISLIIVLNKIFGKSEEERTQEDDLAKLASRGIRPTFPDSAYISYADDLDNALNHVLGSQDVDMVKAIISNMQNDADMIKLDIAYGTRFHFFLTYLGYFTMRAFVRKKLTGTFGGTDEIDELNRILMNKGISYRF